MNRQMDPGLDRVQRWMQAVITHPEGVVGGIGSPDARGEIDVAVDDVESVISRSRNLTSVERLEVYANAYYARLIECMEDEFASTLHAMGAEAFTDFVFAYLQVYPSRSYTLSDLGADFPRFLAESQPSGVDEAEGAWNRFLVDLATLERIYAEVFDGPGIEGQPLLDAEALRSIAPESWPGARLIAVPGLRLVRTQFPVHEYVTAVRHGEEPEPPSLKETTLVVYRRDYVVRRVPISGAQCRLLERLLEGDTVVEAIQRAFRDHDGDEVSLARTLENWFQHWSAGGLFHRVEVRSTPGGQAM